MRIFDFALASWMEPTGVDTAMCTRTGYYRNAGFPVTLVFPTLPDTRDLLLYTGLGLQYEEILAAPAIFTDIRNYQPVLQAEEYQEKIKKALKADDVIRDANEIRYFREGRFLAAMNLTEDGKSFYHVTYFKDGHITRRDYYADTLYASRFYTTIAKDGQTWAVGGRTLLYNRSGSIALTMLGYQGKQYYQFPDGQMMGQSEMFSAFIGKLKLTKEDMIFLDRPSAEVFPKELVKDPDRKPKIVAVFHSEHLFEKGQSVEGVGLNREYWYWTRYSEYIDTMVVSTNEQAKSLVSMLEDMGHEVPEIWVIPVVGIQEKKYPKGERKKKTLVCISRLHVRKKIDWTIMAAVKAHEMDPEISLEIYGGGQDSYINYLENLIAQHGAEDYIHLMGHQNVTEVYKEYSVFLTTSLWETYGITLLEAVSSGLAIIGFDARYGNRLFIEHGKNGYLVPYDPSHFDEAAPAEIEQMAKYIVDLFADEKTLHAFSERSYAISEAFTVERLKEKWLSL